ncbi:hypothetical protein R1flu_001519 [Riccia fluitans]|uniref:Uncharacterized protein n=1 Tax=Riccia fluitans TaxID=41844 RepID=A0ABD1Y3I2_9MARC
MVGNSGSVFSNSVEGFFFVREVEEENELKAQRMGLAFPLHSVLSVSGFLAMDGYVCFAVFASYKVVVVWPTVTDVNRKDEDWKARHPKKEWGLCRGHLVDSGAEEAQMDGGESYRGALPWNLGIWRSSDDENPRLGISIQTQGLVSCE